MREVLRADLSQISLGGLLQLAEAESVCGWITVPTGRLGLHNGLYVGGEFLGLAGVRAGVEALVRARGEATLLHTSDTTGDPLTTATGLLLESCRVLDEIERVGALILTPEAAWAPADPALETLTAALDGKQTLARVIGGSDLRVTEVLDPVLAGIDAGALRVHGEGPASDLDALWVTGGPPARPVLVAAPPEPEPEPAPADFEDLVHAARGYVRDRAFAAAEQALQRALALKPGDRIAAQNLTRVRTLRAADEAA